MEFVGIATRAANSNPFSVCQIAGAVISDDVDVPCFNILIDPKTDFEWHMVQEHLINARSVKGAPHFGDIFSDLVAKIEGRTVIAYGPDAHFAIEELCYRSGSLMPDCHWMDLASILTQAWSDRMSLEEMSLVDVARTMGIERQRQFAYRWDAWDEAEMIKAIFSHLIARVRRKPQSEA